MSAADSHGRTIWIADAHRDVKRFVVRADEKLTAFLELEAAITATAKCGRDHQADAPQSPGPQKVAKANLFHYLYRI